MIKLLFIDHTPFAGGGQLVLAEHIKALDKTQFEVHVACTDAVPDLVERFKAAGATVHILDMPRLRGLAPGGLLGFGRVVRQLRTLLQTEHIDLVVANTTRASYVATLAVMGTHIKLIWWIRDFIYPPKLFKALVGRTQKLIFVSKLLQQHYVAADDPKSVVFYVASSLHEKLDQLTPAEVEAGRQGYGWSPTDVVVGFMGRLVAEKGPEDVLKAVAALAPTYSQLRLVFVGTGKNQRNDVEDDLHRQVADLHLESVVTFAGYQQNEALYYSMMDIFILATRDHEAYATSTVQALMAGKAVIGSRAGGTPELIVDDQTGLLYPPADVAALTTALEKLIQHPELRQRLAETGQRLVLDTHREDQLARKAEALYREVMAA